MSHHYVALLECGHFFELKSSWNLVLDHDSTPNEAFCRKCSEDKAHDIDALVGFKRVLKFAKVEE